jgi:hypothetical protein
MLQKFKDAIPTALLFALVAGLLLPSTLYAGGAATTGLGYGAFLLVALLLAASITIVLAGACALAAPRFDLRPIYLALALALAIKAMLLPSQVPLLDGEASFAAGQSTAGLLSIATIAAALIVGGFVAWRFGVRFVGLALTIVIALSLQPLLDPHNRENMFGAPKSDVGAFFAFSADEPNVLVILIDTFQSDAFAEVLDRDESLRGAFEGFTYFYNTTSSAPYTMLALMPIYSGRTYEGGSIRDFYRTAATDSVFTDFAQQHYATTLGGHYYFDICPASACFQRWQLYDDPPLAGAAAKYLEVLDVSILRIAPTFLQSWIYNAGEGRLQALIKLPDRSSPAQASLAAMEALSHEMNTSSRQPTFKFFHIMATHSPVTLNSACKSIGDQGRRRDAYVAQAHCATRTLAGILAALRERGIYDNTTIVVMSDHGASIDGEAPHTRFLGEVRAHAASNGGRFNALYLVKPAGASGPLMVSAAPAQNADLRATLCDVAISCATTPPGQSPFAMGPGHDRQRRFIDYGYFVQSYTNQHEEMPADGAVAYTIGPGPDALEQSYNPQRVVNADVAALRRAP